MKNQLGDFKNINTDFIKFKLIFPFLDTCFVQDAVYNGDAKGVLNTDTPEICQSNCQYFTDTCDYWTWQPKDSKIIFPESGRNCFHYKTGWKGWKEAGSLFQSAGVASAVSGPKFC